MRQRSRLKLSMHQRMQQEKGRQQQRQESHQQQQCQQQQQQQMESMCVNIFPDACSFVSFAFKLMLFNFGENEDGEGPYRPVWNRV